MCLKEFGDYKMEKDIYDFDGEYAETFQKKCSCGEIILVSTQKDNYPEYYTDIFIKCKCGKSVKFELPVN